MSKKRHLTENIYFYFLIVLCILVFFKEIFTNVLFIPNSYEQIKRIGIAAITPNFNSDIFKKILVSYQNTFLFSSVGLCLGVYLGFILNYFSTKFRKYAFGKYISIVFRSSHEVVCMFLLMIIFGLNIYIAIFAIGISFSGIMSKVFTDNMNLVDEKNFKSFKNRMYTYKNNYFFNMFPQTFNSNLSYVVYRFECAIRSSIVLSYVGLPGIGFYINMSLNDSDFNSLFTYLYSLIIFVLVFGLISTWFLKRVQFKIDLFFKWFVPTSVILMLLFICFYTHSFLELFQIQNIKGIIRSIQAVGNLFNPTYALYSLENLMVFGKYTVQTIILGMVATVFLLIFFNIFIVHYLYSFVKESVIHEKINHIVSVITRSIPEVVFLTFLLFVMKPNVVTGGLALSLHNFGIIIKLVKDRMINNYIDTFMIYKIRKYKSLSLYIFVFLPLMGKDIINLMLYRFEMMIKSSVVIGILGGGGLGYLFRLEMSKFNYESVYFIVFIYIILFVSLDVINKKICKSEYIFDTD